MARNLITFLLIAGITAAGAAAHGFVTGRWQPRSADANLSLPDVPMVIGEWQGEVMKSGLADDPNLRNLTRKYVHGKSGRVLTVSLTVGPAGLTAQHTPEYCYPGSGYQTVGETTEFTTTDSTAQFRSAVYRKANLAGGEPLRIIWAWTADGQWSAPRYPELKFLTGRLYKLYVVSWAADQSPTEDGELRDFLAVLLRQLHQALFAS